MSSADCPKCAQLRDEVAFWKDQQRFAASAAATIADLDEEAPALRQMLRAERDRRHRVEAENIRLIVDRDEARDELLRRVDAAAALDEDLPPAEPVLAAVRLLLAAQEAMLSRWSETDDAGRAALWTGLHTAADDVRAELDREGVLFGGFPEELRTQP